jgi:hypothetical protein
MQENNIEKKIIMYTTLSESDKLQYEYLTIGKQIIIVGKPVENPRYDINAADQKPYRERILEFIGAAKQGKDFEINHLEQSRNYQIPIFTEVNSLKDVNIRKIAKPVADVGDRLFIYSKPQENNPFDSKKGIWFLPGTVTEIKVCNIGEICKFNTQKYFSEIIPLEELLYHMKKVFKMTGWY